MRAFGDARSRPSLATDKRAAQVSLVEPTPVIDRVFGWLSEDDGPDGEFARINVKAADGVLRPGDGNDIYLQARLKRDADGVRLDEGTSPRGYSVETSRGDAAAAAWIFRGDETPRPRRGYFVETSRGGRDADIPWRRVAATPRPRRGYSVETRRRGRDVTFCGEETPRPRRPARASGTLTVRRERPPARFLLFEFPALVADLKVVGSFSATPRAGGAG